MSKVVDEKVVKMEFDNKQFEKNVETSINTIDTLKKSLNFDSSAQSLKNLEKQSEKVDFSTLSDAVDTVKVKFSALETIAITALSNITSRAIDTGIQFAKSLSVDNIAAGWEKFSDKTVSVGTLISQGYDLDTVTEQLDRLNWFTDETSYNFTDMVSNIAKFTASGQDLTKSVTALEGIATWAALSGQNAGTASRAMFQLSQAMGAGVMRKEDYKSIQNVSMDTDEFRQKALDAAVALGTLKKTGEDTYISTVNATEEFTKGQFAEHLTEDAWFNSEVMMKVFNDYSAAVGQIYDYAEEHEMTASEAIEELGDSVDAFGLKAFKAAQEARTFEDVVDSVKDAVSTGWSTTFENIFGNYEEAKELWTDLANELYDVFAEDINQQNYVLAEWKKMGGRDDLIEAFWNVFGEFNEEDGIFKGLLGIIGTIKQAFRDIFPKKTADDLYNFTKKLKDLTAKFQLSTEQMEKLKTVFKGVFSTISIVKQVIIALLKPLKSLGSASGGILTVASDISGFFIKIDSWLKETDVLTKGIQKIKDAIKKFADFIDGILYKITGYNFSDLWEIFKKDYRNFIDFIYTIPSRLKNAFSGVKNLDLAKDVGDKFEKAKTPITAFVDFVKKVFSPIFYVTKWVVNLIRSFVDGVSKSFSNLGKTDLSGAVSFADRVKVIFDGLMTIFSGLKDVVSDVFDFMKSLFSKIREVFVSIIEFIGQIFHATGDAVQGISLTSILDFVKTILSMGLVNNLRKLFGSLGGFVQSFTKAAKSFVGILDSIKGVLESYQKKIKADTIKSIATAVLMMAASIVAISMVDEDRAFSSVAVLAALLAELVAALKIMSDFATNKSSRAVKKLSKTILTLGVALLLMSSALVKIGQLDTGEMIRGVIGIAAMMAILVAALKMMPSDKKMKGMALNILALSVSMVILAGVVKKLGSLDIKTLIKGLVSLAAIMLVLVAAVRLMPKESKMASIAAGLLILSVAMKLFASVVQKLGQLSIKELIKGLAGFAAIIIVLVAAVRLMPSEHKMVSIAAGLLILSVAMKLFASVVQKLGQLSIKELIKGLAGFAAIMIVLVAAIKMMPNESKILGISIGLIAMGTALLIISKAVTQLGQLDLKSLIKGLVAMTVIMAEMVIALKVLGPESAVGALGMMACAAALAIMVPILMALGNLGWDVIGKGLIALAGIFLVFAVAGKVLKSVTPTLLSFGLALLMISAAMLVLGVALGVLAVTMGPFGASFSMFIQGIIDGLVTLVYGIPQIVGALLSSLKSMFGDLSELLITIAELVINVFSKVAGPLIEALVDFLLNLLVTVIHKLAERAFEIVSEVVYLVKEILRALVAAFEGVTFDEIKEVVLALVGALGILSLLLPVMAVATLITAMLPIIGLNMSLFAKTSKGFFELLEELDQNTLMSAQILADTILKFTAASVLDGLTSWFTGGVDYVKFADQLVLMGDGIREFGQKVKDVDAPQVKAAAEAASMITQVANNLPRSGGILQEWIGSKDLSKFAEEVKDMGPSIADFSKYAKKVDAAAVIGASLAAMSITKVANNLPRSGGILQEWIGSKDLSKFAKEVKDMGPSIADFSNYAKKVNPQTVIGASLAAQAIVSVANNLPRSGGILQDWIGSKDLSKFAAEVDDMGPSIADFSKYAKRVDRAAVIGASYAAQSILKVANNLPRSGGILQEWIGSKDLSKFADEMKDAGPSIADFSKNAKKVDRNAVVGAAYATQAIVKVANNLPDFKPAWLNWLTGGQMSLSSFGKEMSKFGGPFSEFAEKISKVTITKDQINSVVDSTIKMVDIVNNLPDQSGGFISWFTGGKMSLTDFGQEMEWFAPRFVEFANKISSVSIDTDKLESVVSATVTMIGVANELPTQSDGLLSWFYNENRITLSDFGSQMAAFATSFKSFVSEISSLTFTSDDADKVKLVATATTDMATAAKDLPEQPSIFKSWFDGTQVKLSEFGLEMAAFAPSFVTFAESISALDDTAINKAVKASHALPSIGRLVANLPNDEGLITLWAKKQNLSKFGEELAAFGPSYATFLGAFSSLTQEDANKVSAISPSFSALAALIANLPTDASPWIKFWFGEKQKLSDFGSDLSSFGHHFALFSAYMVQVREDGTDFNFLIDFVKQLGDLILQIEDYDSDIFKAFTADLPSLGRSIQTIFKMFVDTSNVLDGFIPKDPLQNFSLMDTRPLVMTQDKIDIMEQVITMMGDLLDLYYDFAGKVQEHESTEWINTSQASFISFMDCVQNMMLTFKEGTYGLDKENIDNFLTFLKDLYSIASEIATIDPTKITKFFTSLTGIPTDTIATMLGTVQEKLPEARTKVDEFLDVFIEEADAKKPDIVGSFNSIILTILLLKTVYKKRLKNFGKSIVQYIIDGIDNKRESLLTTIGNVFTSALNRAKAAISGTDWVNVGETIIDNTKDGVVESEDVLMDAIWEVMSASLDEMFSDENYKEITESGENVVNGLIKGINNKKSDLVDVTEEIGQTIPKTLKNTLMEQSPSKLTKEIGEYAGEGLLIGLASYGQKIEQTSEDVGLEAEKGLSLAMSRIRDIILADPDDTLTIRPVLDLSEIQNGARQLYSMMPGSTSFGISTNYGFANEVAGRVRNVELTRNGSSEIISTNTSDPDSNKAPSTFNNTFNIQGDDPRSIATEVSRIIQRQTERKEAVWGS